MHKIFEIIEEMEDELEDAEDYAERAVECAAHKHRASTSAYISMAEDELRHFEKLDAMLKEHYESLEGNVKEFVDHKHAHLMREHAEIKYMLTKAAEN